MDGGSLAEVGIYLLIIFHIINRICYDFSDYSSIDYQIIECMCLFCIILITSLATHCWYMQ